MSQHEDVKANMELSGKVAALLREMPHRQAFHATVLWLASYILEHYPDEVDEEIETVTRMLENGIAAMKAVRA